MHNATAYSASNEAPPAASDTANTPTQAALATCTAMIIRRRSLRSAIAPPTGPNSSQGR